ncbi:MAG: TIGR02281 family clan AA aspartic protease [Sphingosinicella sp.]|nr:TIGR02281 family clan AA aspartic protease [Sphingosinicella sp.]
MASGLMVRGIPMRQGFKMMAGWIIIFLLIFVLFALKDDILRLGKRVMDESRAEQGGVQVGGDLRIRQSPDGHFWVNAQLNGQIVRFLIDSGATTTSISAETARQANIRVGGGFPVLVNTANGSITVQRARVENLQVGQIEREDFAVHVSEAFGDMNVLGMNFLSSLSGWRVEGTNLILTP